MTDIRDIKKLRAEGQRLGREGLSQRVIALIAEFDGSYKGAMRLAGRMRAISLAAGFDDYWSEQVSRGYHDETFHITKFERSPPTTLGDGA